MTPERLKELQSLSERYWSIQVTREELQWLLANLDPGVAKNPWVYYHSDRTRVNLATGEEQKLWADFGLTPTQDTHHVQDPIISHQDEGAVEPCRGHAGAAEPADAVCQAQAAYRTGAGQDPAADRGARR